MKKKLLIIDNSVSFTGAFKCAYNEATLLADKLEISFVIPAESRLERDITAIGSRAISVPMLEIGKSARKLFFYLPMLFVNGLRLRRLVKREQIQIVQVNDFYNLLGVFLKFTGCKITLLTNVRFLPSALPGPLRKLWTFFGQRYSDKVICVSDAVLQQLPIHKDTIRIYDPVAFKNRHETVETKEDGLVHFLYIANYIIGKGQDFALSAFKKAYEENKGIRLQFAGGDMGLEKNRAFKQRLMDDVRSSGLEEAITFLPFVEDVELVIKQSDVVLNFSESESFSMTCLEASFYGRPVIATKCGGPEEIIEHRGTGLLVANRNTEEMTAAILEVAGMSQAARGSWGDAGRASTKNKFSTENFLTAFMAVIS